MHHLTTIPWRHQQAAIDFALHKPGAYLALRMGEGKSLCAIALVDLRQCQRTLIVCPKSVVDVWPGEFQKHTDGTYLVVPLQGGSISERAKLVRRSIEKTEAMHRPLVLVLNYEAAWREPMAETLLKAHLDCVITDEAHRLKSAGGRTSLFFSSLGKRVPWRVGLSGTPMPHALANDSPVLTPSGWKAISELSVGDYVIGSSGSPTRVIGVWPQGIQPLYSVEFSDNSSVVCTGDHLWKVISRGRASRGLPWLIKSTNSLADPLPLPRSNIQRIAEKSLFDKHGAARWNIQLADVSQFNSQTIPLDPYLLGVLLGDGTFGKAIAFTTPDQQIADEIRRVLPDGLQLTEHRKEGVSAIDYRITSGKRGGSVKGPVRGPAKNAVMLAIDELGLRYHHSEDKFVPKCYLWNTADVRLAILQGLCDTDGSNCAGGSPARFVTTSKQLSEDVTFLVRSLGGLVTQRVQPPMLVTLPQGGTTISRPMYVITFRMSINPFRLERKHNKYRVSPRKPRRSIIAINRVTDGESTCITVDADDGLYVTKDFIVTHNSPLDVYAQYRFIDNRIFGTSNARFKARYALFGGFNGKQVTGFVNQDELQRKFYSIAFRVEEDVLDLPDATHQTRFCEASPKTARIYRDLADEFYAQVEAGEVTVANALTKIIRLQQVTSGYIVTDDGETHEYGNEKASLLADILDDIDPHEPLVVFVRFHHDLDRVREVLEQSGRSCAELSGRVNQYLSWKGGEATAIVTQIQSGSLGIDLTRARYCLYYSVDHSLGNFEQSQCRILRPGQTRNVTYIYLAMKGTIDTAIYRALRKKSDVIKAVLNRQSADEDDQQLVLLS